MSLSLKDSLIENDSIITNAKAKTWQESILRSVEPLIKSGACTKKYYENIIKSVEEIGPYFIICPLVAMPHAAPADGVNKDAFSLVILDKPVKFSSGQEVQLLLCLCATSADIHMGVAIPQICAIFEEKSNIQKLISKKNKKEILEFLGSIDLNKYVTN